MMGISIAHDLGPGALSTGDVLNPTVVITSAAASTVYTAFSVTITFSEVVFGFVVGDITVTNGSAGSFVAGSGSVYTATITPTLEGTVTVGVAAGVCQDAAGNPNTAATNLTREYDPGAGYAQELIAGGADLVFRCTDMTTATITAYAAPTYNGTATNWTLTAPNAVAGPVTGETGLAPYNGGTGYGNILTAPLISLFNPLAVSAFVWGKLPSAAWTDGLLRAFFRFTADADNYIMVYKSTSSNTIQALYRAGGTNSGRSVGSLTSTDWLSVGFSVDKAGNTAELSVNGVSPGPTAVGGVWAGGLATALIGAITTGPGNPFLGNEAYLAFKFGLPVWTPANYLAFTTSA